jgi:hypothetical protein
MRTLIGIQFSLVLYQVSRMIRYVLELTSPPALHHQPHQPPFHSTRTRGHLPYITTTVTTSTTSRHHRVMQHHEIIRNKLIRYT